MLVQLPFSLGRFDEETEDLGWEQELEKFEAEWEQSQAETETEPETETEVEEPTDETEEQEQTEDSETEVEKKDSDKPFQNEKQNEAFAKMRRELEQYKKYGGVIEKIAEREGTDPDKIVEQFQQRMIEEEAKKQNTDPEVWKKLKEQEAELERLKTESFSKEFNAKVEATKEKYGLGEDELVQVFDFYKEKELSASVDFESAYKLANYDKLVNKAKEEAVQAYLEEKKKQRETSAVPTTGSGSAPTNNPNTLSDDEYEAMKKSLGLE